MIDFIEVHFRPMSVIHNFSVLSWFMSVYPNWTSHSLVLNPTLSVTGRESNSVPGAIPFGSIRLSFCCRRVSHYTAVTSAPLGDIGELRVSHMMARYSTTVLCLHLKCSSDVQHHVVLPLHLGGETVPSPLVQHSHLQPKGKNSGG